MGMKLFIELADTIEGLSIKDRSMYGNENTTLVTNAIDEIA
jgi:hypothetical protein